jgi:glycosyltransferase involved in cell wall biosynthesis
VPDSLCLTARLAEARARRFAAQSLCNCSHSDHPSVFGSFDAVCPVPRPLHIVHITPSFGLGGAQIRTVQLMNHLGGRFRHTVVALDDDIRAAEGIANDIAVNFAKCPRTRNPLDGTARLYTLLNREKPDLVLTYNWGSMDGVQAAIACNRPIIHTEDGFGDDEALRQRRRRVWHRRVVLRAARVVVAPSKTLAKIMSGVWKLPTHLIRYIPNGVDIDKFSPAPASEVTRNSVVVGTVGQFRREKRQDLLIEACAMLASTQDVRLVLVGDGPEKVALRKKTHALDFDSRVDFPGRVLEPQGLYRQFDIFALSSSTEQMPLSVLEAMASGLPVLSTDVGDIKSMVSVANQEFVTNWAGYQEALGRLAADAPLRRHLGSENRIRCTRVHSLGQMVMEYEKLFLQTARARRDVTFPVRASGSS